MSRGLNAHVHHTRGFPMPTQQNQPVSHNPPVRADELGDGMPYSRMQPSSTDQRLGGVMATIAIDVTDDEAQQLADAAGRQGMTAEALIRRWVQERLVHERERAAGGGKALSPRARREQEKDV